MAKTQATTEAATIPLYHKTGADVVGVGIASPSTPANVPSDLAQLWLKDNPKIWSRKPFIDLKSLEVKPNG